MMAARRSTICAVNHVEGLAGPDGAIPIGAKRVVGAAAKQCGFCTAGLVMRCSPSKHGGEPADTASSGI